MSIKPALTKEEWAEWWSADAETGDNPDIVDDWYNHSPLAQALPVEIGNEQAVVALLLDGQSFGFTKETLRLLSMGVPVDPGLHKFQWTREDIDAAEAELAKIEALLAPEGTSTP